MQIGFKYHKVKGFGRLYEYAYRNTHMITKEAKTRLKIILFWKEHGLKATKDAFNANRSTLFAWNKIYKESGNKIESLNPKSQARHVNNKREIHSDILKEIKRLRIEVCPNMGKAKVKKYLDLYCKKNNLPIYSESKIGRIIKERKIYHHRQKIAHDGTIKTVNKTSDKKRQPKGFVATEPGDLVQIDTIVKFVHGMRRYIITAVDVKTKYAYAKSYKSHGSLSAKHFFMDLEKAFPYRIKAVQTDNGSEFHRYFKEYLERQNIVHYFNYKGKPTKNGHVERFNRTIQEEFVDWNEILLEEPEIFNDRLVEWLLWYNTKRYHWGLNLDTPINYLLTNYSLVQYEVN